MRSVRVALCQLESHPAFYGGTVAYPEEPFVPTAEGGSLSRLGTKGIDVQALQDFCKAEYAAWSRARLQAAVSFLSKYPTAPDIVLFPEGAVLMEMLPLLAEWSAESGVTILGGTHTPLATTEGLRCYKSLGIGERERTRAMRARAGSVLPLMRMGRVLLISKELSSPFERTDVTTPNPDAISPGTYPIRAGGSTLDLLPLICIEALRPVRVDRSYDIVGVVSYDARPDQFQPFIELQVRSRKPVLFCNDGRYGKTRIGAAHDARALSWLLDALPDGLPPGDGIIIVDLDLDVTAVEVATATPGSPSRLVALASVAYEQSESGSVARDLCSVHDLPAGVARAQELTRILQVGTPDSLQRVRLSHLRDLEARGVPTDSWWEALGADCVVPGRGDLRSVESRLAAACRDSLTSLLSSELGRRSDIAQLFLGFYAECKTKAGAAEQSRAVAQTADATAVIDREAEVQVVTDFLDSRNAVVLEVSGLLQIGKSAVIEKALAQSGVKPILRVPLTSTSSPDYILYSILKCGSGLPEPPYTDPVAIARGTTLASALRSVRILVIERAHLLSNAGTWRDERMGDVLIALVDTARDCGVKLILETQRELPLGLGDPSIRRPLRVWGLYKHLRPYGQALFDAQLRRVGLAPDILSDEAKGAIVERLGGHPVALALAADASYEEGGDGVLSALKDRKGFYLTFLKRLLAALGLTNEDQTILRLLTLARAPVERSVVLGSVTFPAAPVMRNLVALGTIEVTTDGRVEVAGVLREYFDPRELPPEAIEAFHRAAASAFESRARRNPRDLDAAIEAEYHAGVVGVTLDITSKLLDGTVATAREYFDAQRYDKAAAILAVLLRKRRSLEVLRLAALVEARLTHGVAALDLAREVLTRDPNDTQLLADLAKIALSQYQDDTLAMRLIEIARGVGVEDVSVLVVEGRLYLRRHQLQDAERVLQRARQLTVRNPWPYYYLGLTYQRLGHLDEAIEVLLGGQEFVYEMESRSRNALNAIRTQLGYVYLLAGETEAAGHVLDPLFEDDPTSPEVVRAYAALTIRRNGIQEAQKAFARLNEAEIRNRFDRCQFHLLYGLFQLGIGNPHEANREFAKAHVADPSNVYVMMKWARTVYEIAEGRYVDGDDSYRSYLSDCSRLVHKILEFDPDNRDGVTLMNSLYQNYGIDVGTNGEVQPSAE